MGRWRAYMANGHGGNLLLRQRGHQDYTVSILEVASPDMSRDDILAREGFWKDKLGARLSLPGRISIERVYPKFIKLINFRSHIRDGTWWAL